MKHSNRTRELPACSAVLQRLRHHVLLGKTNTKRYRLWQLLLLYNCITLKCAQLRENLTALRQLQHSCEGEANPTPRPAGIRL